ncbi:MAG: DMT family transporter [Betaproteobacteria bacterium]|nr:DMT family transporter [Betaproteobacteria bacterium]
MAGRHQTVARLSLLTGAVVWGMIWYPYRLLEQAGLSGVLASVLSYSIALGLGLILLRPRLQNPGHWRFSWMLVLIGLSAGACNLGYVLATLHGEVMRVLLLFYLAPLWTVLWSRLLLKERLTGVGAAVIALSSSGAAVMLWRPELGMPWPASFAEWLGLAAGFMFALSNVLVRRAAHLSVEIKSLAVFAGVMLLGLVVLLFDATPSSGLAQLQPWHWGLLALLGPLLLVINLVVQHGLTHTPANQAIVIFLFELVVAAFASWLLASELMGLQEWIGGAMIVAASLFSGKIAETV